MVQAATTPEDDQVAPAAITDLTVVTETDTNLTLNWTAPGDDGSTGTATSYDLRYSTTPISNDSDFAGC